MNSRRIVLSSILSVTVLALSPLLGTSWAQTETTVYSFRGGANGSEPAGALIRDSQGNFYGTASTSGSSNCPGGCGLVFKVSQRGFTILHSFTGGPTDGDNPQGALLRDKSGNLYGTTGQGGTNGNGTVYEITPSGTEMVLWSFGPFGSGDGSGPNSGLAMDAQGNLYGTTFRGGVSGFGTVYKITASGVESVLYSFLAGSDGVAPVGAPIVDKAGNIYGTTSGGGNDAAGTVYKISASGEETILHSFQRSSSDGDQPCSSLALGPSGNLFGTTEFGGTQGRGTVFVINPVSGYERVLYSFGSQTGDGTLPFAGVTFDSKGTIYGTTLNGGYDNVGTVYSLTASGTESVLYGFGEQMFDGDVPYGTLLPDGQGNLYGTTFIGGQHGEGAIFRFTP